MKKYILFMYLLCSEISYSQNWIWAKGAHPNVGGYAEAFSCDQDTLGNILVTGGFSFPSLAFGSYTLAGSGSESPFLAKYDNSGNVLWAKSGNSYSGPDYGRSVSANLFGNVFVTGCFSSLYLAFGSNTLTNNGIQNLFITKYDAAGNVLWARNSDGGGDTYGTAVASYKNDNAFVTGTFNSPTLALGNFTLTNSGGYDCFIARYNANGNVLWAKALGGLGGDYGSAIVTDNDGNIFITGSYDSQTLTIGSTSLVNTGNGTITNVFVAKYDSLGNLIWAKGAGGSGDDESKSICSFNNEIFITGTFKSSSMSLGTTTLSNSNGGSAVFVAKYDNNGNVLWAKKSGGTNTDIGYSIGASSAGIYVVGSLTSPTITFDSYTLSIPLPIVDDPMFVTRYDNNGNVICAERILRGGNALSSVHLDNSGNAIIVGSYMQSGFVIGSNTLALIGNRDLFVSKFVCQSPSAVKIQSRGLHTTLFPNPSGGKFSFKFENDVSNGKLILLNSLGQIVHLQKISGGEAEVQLTNISTGMYHCIISENGRIIDRRKIIIE